MYDISGTENTSERVSRARGDLSDAGILSASKGHREGSFYTSEISVPIAVPRDTDLLPTFHSCLVSRVYSLSVLLSVNASSFNDQMLHLKVPIEITTERSGVRSESTTYDNEGVDLVIDGRTQNPLYCRIASSSPPPYSA
jgi:hypothetical protein